MVDYAFETVDVFTNRRFGGNPLAVVTDARGLDGTAMQRIAREFNLSETTFVLPPDDPSHTARVRIFTPMSELPFAGHPNVGTALVLAWRRGDRPGRMVFEEDAGLVEMSFDWSGEGARATLQAPAPLILGETIPAETIAECAGLAVSDVLVGSHQPVMASVGNPFPIAEVTLDALGRAVANPVAMQAASLRHAGLPGGIRFPLHLHARTAGGRRTRMFAPLAGIAEDPATGSANVALAALLLSLTDEITLSIEIEQGVEMGRPSLMLAGAWRAGDGIRAWVGGGAVPVMTGVISV